MVKRLAVLIGLFLAAAGIFAVPSAQGQEASDDTAGQEQAAEEVMEQLEATDEPMAMSEIDGLDEMGPAPWLSFTRPRSEKVLEAWMEVAEQLPTASMAADEAPGDRDPIVFDESENPGETGGNDSPDIGDAIDGFGTGKDDARMVTISGSLSGGDGPPEPPGPVNPCVSAEDDGAIPLANQTESVGMGDDELFVAICVGEIGDGPQDATGDVDFYSTREMTAGKVLVVDFFSEDPDSVAGDFTIGVYDGAGTLLASGQDSPAGDDTNFFQYTVPATGVYHVAIGGGLPTDPFDSTTGTDTEIVDIYDVAIVDITQELLDEIIGEPEPAGFRALSAAANAEEEPEEPAEPVADIDFFLVDLEAGDAISGGFDNVGFTGILDPAGVGRMASFINPSFIYPADSVLRHERLAGFDHVAAVSGVHAVFVSSGEGLYEGELRIARSGLADVDSDGQQIIYLDFDGAAVSPSIFDDPSLPPVPAVDLTPLSSFLSAWDLDAADEDAVIDATIDAVIENLDTDLRILDGRNGDRDASGTPTEFDIEVLNSRDHGDPWGETNVSRIVIGGTIAELTIPTIGIAQSIDPGNQETEETGVVLLDILSGPSTDSVSLNAYTVAAGRTKAEFVGYAVGHIAAHEVGHFIGNWHTDTFNPNVSLMDAGGEFLSVFGVGADGVFGTADDIDADFAEDFFSTGEPFAGVEDTAARSVFALSTGMAGGGGGGGKVTVMGVVRDTNGDPVADVAVDLFTATETGERVSYVGTERTDADGKVYVGGEPGCWAVVFIAPDGQTFVPTGSQYNQQFACLEDGDSITVNVLLTSLDPGATTSIGGTVLDADGSGAQVVVDLFAAGGDGSRAGFLGDRTTDADGAYSFVVAPGCYVTVMIAPEGRTFVGGSQWNQQTACVKAGETLDGINGQLAPAS